MRRQSHREHWAAASWLSRAVVRLWPVLILACPARGSSPVLEHIFPVSISPAVTNEITVAGKFEPWPPKVWTSCAGVTFTARTNVGQFVVTVAADAPAGAHLLRLFNEEGCTPPRIFVISSVPELLEEEPNDHLAEAEPVSTLPATFNGHLNKAGDVDAFAVDLVAGQWLDAQVEAYTLASKADALLRLVTPDGVQQAWNHDFRTLDPRLLWRVPSNGVYILQVMAFKYPAEAQVRLTGGNGCVYRLHLKTLSGPPAAFSGGIPEHEPNNSPTNALALTLPATAVGTIGSSNDQDWSSFVLSKDDAIELTLESATLGSPLDAWVKITDAEGKVLAGYEEMTRFRDPRLEWKASTDGTFCVAVGNLLHAAGDAYAYRLVLRKVLPECRATVARDSMTLSPGETNDVKVTVLRRHGFDHKLSVEFSGLPEGAHADPVDVPEKSGECTVRLVATPDATPVQTPVRLVLRDSTAAGEQAVLFSLTSQSEDNGVPGGYHRLLVESTDQLWLTVKPKTVSP